MSLRMAAEVIMDSPAALQVPYKSYLRYKTYEKKYLTIKSHIYHIKVMLLLFKTRIV